MRQCLSVSEAAISMLCMCACSSCCIFNNITPHSCAVCLSLPMTLLLYVHTFSFNTTADFWRELHHLERCTISCRVRLVTQCLTRLLKQKLVLRPAPQQQGKPVPQAQQMWGHLLTKLVPVKRCCPLAQLLRSARRARARLTSQVLLL